MQIVLISCKMVEEKAKSTGFPGLKSQNLLIAAKKEGISLNATYEQRPEKLFIGFMTRYACSLHVHEQAEIVVILRGTVVMTIGETQYRLRPGDTAVIFPLMPHSYDELLENHQGIICIIPPDIIPEYASTFHSLLPDCPILRAGASGQDLSIVAERISRLSMDHDLPLCVAYLHVLLASTMHRLSFRPVYDYTEQDLGGRIIRYIAEHAFEEITLESASRSLGISVSHLSHFFSERMHINFRRFINAIRIEKARLLMRDPNLTLTEICDLCGYTDMRTFRRAFQSEMNYLPSDYIQALRQRPIADSPSTERS